jgi:hypothetical protein
LCFAQRADALGLYYPVKTIGPHQLHGCEGTAFMAMPEFVRHMTSRAHRSRRDCVAGGTFGADLVTEAAGRRQVGEAAGAHAPPGVAAHLDIADRRIATVEKVREAVQQYCPLLLRPFLCRQRCKLHLGMPAGRYDDRL